jgi:hypothetical protein
MREQWEQALGYDNEEARPLPQAALDLIARIEELAAKRDPDLAEAVEIKKKRLVALLAPPPAPRPQTQLSIAARSGASDS